MKQNKPFIIGLTGTIGSGKSTVSKILNEKFGIPVVDADQIARDITSKGSKGLSAIEKEFGKEFILDNGEYNRELMAKTVFDDPTLLEKLNGLLHPLIKEEKERQFKELDDSPIIVYDCPLLFETNEDKGVDQILLVTLSEEKRIERLKSRDNKSEKDIKKVLDSQLNEIEKINNSDIIIYNEGTVDDLKNALDDYIDNLRKGFNII